MSEIDMPSFWIGFGSMFGVCCLCSLVLVIALWHSDSAFDDED